MVIQIVAPKSHGMVIWGVKSVYIDKYTYPNFLDQKELDENRRQSGIEKEAKENNRIKKDEFTLTYNTKIGDKNDLNILGFYQKTDIPSESIEDYTSEYKGMLAGQAAGLRKALRNPRLPALSTILISASDKPSLYTSSYTS